MLASQLGNTTVSSHLLPQESRTPGAPQPCRRNSQTHGTPPASHPAGVWCASLCQGRHTHWDTGWWPLGQELAAGPNTNWPLSHPCDQQLIPDQAISWDIPSPGREVALAQPQWPYSVTVTQKPPPEVCSTLCPNPARPSACRRG